MEGQFLRTPFSSCFVSRKGSFVRQKKKKRKVFSASYYQYKTLNSIRNPDKNWKIRDSECPEKACLQHKEMEQNESWQKRKNFLNFQYLRHDKFLAHFWFLIVIRHENVIQCKFTVHCHADIGIKLDLINKKPRFQSLY